MTRKTIAQERREEQAEAAELDAAKRKAVGDLTPPPRIAADYVHTTRPDGVDVVFIPGEALPDWVTDDAIKPGSEPSA